MAEMNTSSQIPSLFRASSTIPKLNGMDNVTVEWIVPFRPIPAVHYGEHLSQCFLSNPRARQGVDEFMTEGEIDALQDYLKGIGISDFRDSRIETKSAWRRCIMLPGNGTHKFLKLDDQIGYNLPFRIWGLIAPQPRISGADIQVSRIKRKSTRTCALSGRAFEQKPPFGFHLGWDSNRVVSPDTIQEFADLKEAFGSILELQRSTPILPIR